MSDQKNVVTFQSGGTPITASTQEPGNVSQPQMVTLDEAKRMAQEAEERAVSRAQALVDKADSRISKRVRADQEALERTLKIQREQGIQITPQQEADMRNRIIQQAFNAPVEPDQPPASGRHAAQAVPQEQGMDPTTATALRMMQKAGIYIQDGDPELAMIDQSDEDNFLLTLGPAIQAKRQRLTQVQGAAQGFTSDRQPSGQAPASAPITPTNAGGSGSGLPLEQQYQTELKQVAGNVGAVIELKRKYRQRGLNVW